MTCRTFYHATGARGLKRCFGQATSLAPSFFHNRGILSRQAPFRSHLKPYSISPSSSAPSATDEAALTVPEPGTTAHKELAQSLAGSVQAYRCHVFLRSPVPPSAFPAKFSTALQRALLLRFMRQGVTVTHAWYPYSDSGPEPGEVASEVSESSTSVITHDRTSAVAFSALGGRLEFPEISMENLDAVEAQLRAHLEGSTTTTSSTGRDAAKDVVDIYVCTHGARDCRCGDIGGRVAKAFVDAAERFNARSESDVPRVRVGEVGHVGGHKYAANVLVYPQGEWLGLVRPEQVPELLESIVASPMRPLTPTDPPLVRRHWRGRIGMAKDEQLALYEGGDRVTVTETATLQPRGRGDWLSRSKCW